MKLFVGHHETTLAVLMLCLVILKMIVYNG